MVIDGKQIAEKVLESLKNEINSKGLKLRLVAVLVGDDPEFEKFVELKKKAAEKVGIDFETFQYPGNVTTEELKKEIGKIAENSDGVLVELPLPNHIDQQAVLDEIPVEKDVDVLSSKAQDKFYEVLVLPPAVEALKIVFEKYDIELASKRVAVFGYGLLIGKPIAHWLEKQGAEVSVIRSKTENPAEISKKADIIISGVGKPNLITGDMVKDGVIVIDFGYGKKDEKMVGDVDFESISKRASLITPVPGGMGPILIAAVLRNLLILNSRVMIYHNRL